MIEITNCLLSIKCTNCGNNFWQHLNKKRKENMIIICPQCMDTATVTGYDTLLHQGGLLDV